MVVISDYETCRLVSLTLTGGNKLCITQYTIDAAQVKLWQRCPSPIYNV